MAQKETVNTFTGGLVMDTHPLTTPKDVLTNCLNGTLVTFNGNEMILQNDMGNTKIDSKANGDSVRLQNGFVPVGTAELGGIIYITSYNPETRECEIGCFPSPERNKTSEEGGVGGPFEYDDLFQNSYLDVIKENEINDPNALKVGLHPLIKGYKKIDLTTVELHAGDRFTINLTDNSNEPIEKNDNLDYKIISLTEDGEIIDLDINDFGREFCYTATSPGKLAILISPKKINTFSFTYSNLRENGLYVSTETTASNAIEIDSVPDKKVADYIVIKSYNYYKLNKGTSSANAIPQISGYYVDACSEEDNSENKVASEYVTLSGNLSTFILKDSNGIPYVYDSLLQKFVFLNNNYQGNGTNIENLTEVFLENNKFKILDTESYYLWDSEENWKVDLNFSFNDKNKENEKVSDLNSVLLRINSGDWFIKSDFTTTTLSGLIPNENGIINIDCYPIILLGSDANRIFEIENKEFYTDIGYIEELTQSVIIDTNLEEGDVVLNLWKYYYSNNVINLSFGFAGLLNNDQNITGITLCAIEYKDYGDNGYSDEDKIEIINLLDKDSYLGSFYEKIELGENLLPDKLYAIEIKITLDYSPGIILEHRWLYTSDVFNYYFDQKSVLDFNKYNLRLDDLKVELNIDPENNVIPPTTANGTSFDFTTKPSDYLYPDYKTYGYTKNEYIDVIRDYIVQYSTNNPMFTLLPSEINSSILEIEGKGLTSDFHYEDEEDLVLNSYPGQEKEPSGIKDIWDSPKAYEKYTDFMKVELENGRLKFTGRIYNKIKGSVGKDIVEGSYIYSPLVWNKTTALNYDLEWNSDLQKLVPIYYLNLEVFPKLQFTLKGNNILTGNCDSTYDSAVSLYKVRLLNVDNKIKMQFGELSYEDIENRYTWKGEAESTNINSLDSVTGSNLVKTAYNNITNRGILNVEILPMIFTTPYGKVSQVSSGGGKHEDYGKETPFPSVSFDTENHGVNDNFGYGRNYYRNDNLLYQKQRLYLGFVVLDKQNDSLTLYIIQDVSNKPFMSITETGESFDYLSKKLFNILSLIYVRSGQTGEISFCYIDDLKYQIDYESTFTMEANIETKVNHHKVLNTYEGFNDWNDENLNVGEYTIYNKVVTSKAFEVKDKLYEEYVNRGHDSVLEFYRGSESKIKGCIQDITLPNDSNPNPPKFYILCKNTDLNISTQYILSNGESRGLNFDYVIDNIDLSGDIFQYELIEQSNNLSNLLNYDGEQFTLSSLATPGNITLSNYSAKAVNNQIYSPIQINEYKVSNTKYQLTLTGLVIDGTL